MTDEVIVGVSDEWLTYMRQLVRTRPVQLEPYLRGGDDEESEQLGVRWLVELLFTDPRALVQDLRNVAVGPDADAAVAKDPAGMDRLQVRILAAIALVRDAARDLESNLAGPAMAFAEEASNLRETLLSAIARANVVTKRRTTLLPRLTLKTKPRPT